jgi:hypothetical protein
VKSDLPQRKLPFLEDAWMLMKLGEGGFLGRRTWIWSPIIKIFTEGGRFLGFRSTYQKMDVGFGFLTPKYIYVYVEAFRPIGRYTYPNFEGKFSWGVVLPRVNLCKIAPTRLLAIGGSMSESRSLVKNIWSRDFSGHVTLLSQWKARIQRWADS